MKTKTVELYKFNELAGRAKDNAEAYLSEHLTSGDWYAFVYQDWIPKLEERGFDNPKIMFSHMYRQGQGACFEVKEVDIEKWLKFHKLGNTYRAVLNAAKTDDVSLRIYHNDNLYHHYNTMYIQDHDWLNDDDTEYEFEKVADLILEDAKELAKQIYDALEEEDMAITSDESLAEYADEEGIMFLEDGHPVEDEDETN